MEFFTDDDYYTGPPLTPDAIARAEQTLGLTLPTSYTTLLTQRNGGVPHKRCYPTTSPTSWAADHFEIRAILGIGGQWGIDTDTNGSVVMIAEWDYPPIGIVLCDTPSGGHDTVMLDYSDNGPTGEPAVAYIDEDRQPRRIAPTFADFIANLTPCD